MASAQTVNPLTLAVIRHKLQAIAEEMVETMTHTCFSPILNQNQDFSSVILDRIANTVAQAERVPIHMGAMSWAIKAMANEFEDLSPGDVLVANDPYAGGSHLPDITMAKPVFVDGKLQLWVSIRAHQGDIGGISAGGYSASAREIWHEGLRVPPVRLITKGLLHEDILNLIAWNSRKASDLKGDLRAQISAVEVGARRLEDLLKRYGTAEIQSCAEAILDAGEVGMRSLLRRCRPGRYDATSYLETEDGADLIPIRAVVEIVDGRAVVDLTQCPDQTNSFINSPIANTRASVNVAFLYLNDDDQVLNDGSTRAIELKTRQGSIVDPVEPGPVAGCTSLTASAIIEAVLIAMTQALPENAIAGFARRFRFALAGHGENGESFIWHSFFNRGGAGANAQTDGWPNLGGIHNPGGTPSPSIERTEAAYPLVIEEYALRQDSGGAGLHRGGLGGRISIRYEGTRPAILNAAGEGIAVHPYGLSGGGSAPGHDYIIERLDGEVLPVGGRDSGIELLAGDRIVCQSSGGGGFGDPQQRPREQIAADIVNGYISEHHAREVYGFFDVAGACLSEASV